MADPYSANVSLLLHCDGTNGSTTFTDSSLNTKTITAVGAILSTTSPKFGTAGFYSSAADPSHYLYGTGSSDFSFGTGDYTVEFWINPITRPSLGYIYCNSDTTNAANAVTIALHPANGFLFTLGNNASFYSLGTVTNNTWYHVAVSRSGTSVRAFINGTQVGSTGTDTATHTIGANAPYINGGVATGTNSYLDEIRVTKGIARYTSNFTPPAAAFDNPSTTVAHSIVGNIPLVTTVAATLQKHTATIAHSIVGNIPLVTTVAAVMHKRNSNYHAIIGNIPLTTTVAATMHKRTAHRIVGNIPLTTTVAATLQKHTATIAHNIVGNIPLTTTVAALLNSHIMPRVNIEGGGFNSVLTATLNSFENMAVQGGAFTSSLSSYFGGNIEGGNFNSVLDSTITGIPSFFISGGAFNSALSATISYETNINAQGGAFKSSLEANFGWNTQGGGFASSLSAEFSGWASLSVAGGAFTSVFNSEITGYYGINVKGGAFRSQLLWMDIQGGGFSTGLKAHIDVGAANSVAFCMNIITQESTRWTNIRFNHIIAIGQKYFGVTDAGLFEISTNYLTDNSVPINGIARLRDDDYGSFNSKNCPAVYLDSDTKTHITPFVDGVKQHTYPSQFNGRKTRLGLGNQGRYWQFEIQNIVKLNGLEVLVAEKQRRVK